MPQKNCGLLYATVASLVSPLTMTDPMINGLVVSALFPQKQNDIYIYTLNYNIYLLLGMGWNHQPVNLEVIPT
jgi:hypothetical protein